MRTRPRKVVREVTQLIGGVGSPEAQMLASRLCSHLAELTSASPIYLAAPGVVATKSLKNAIMSDPAITDSVEAWKRITTLIVGIGTFPASPLLAASGNTLEQGEEEQLKKDGAVGEICLRYFDKDGHAMNPVIEDRVISIDAKSMQAAPRRIGVAGGAPKLNAIRAAITGGWINVLITDAEVARLLLEPPRLKKK
jgi:DNA-binding transcriptional regulator LsrR (DeoR family)